MEECQRELIRGQGTHIKDFGGGTSWNLSRMRLQGFDDVKNVTCLIETCGIFQGALPRIDQLQLPLNHKNVTMN
jgi:hypothetical protein